MTSFYRVHPWIDGAPIGAKGHPFFIPPQGKGRIDNPDQYQSYYVSSTATGAIAEIFGDYGEWTPDLFLGPPGLAGSVMGLTRFESSLNLVDLDDPGELHAIILNPSRVVTRHRSVTQAWALALFLTRADAAGVKWWSYHEPEWSSVGLWDFSTLVPVETVPLSETHPGFIQARALLARPWRAP